jgi:hypothetical protein
MLGPSFKKIKFIETKIESEHLDLLASLIDWVEPKDLNIVLSTNEIDDFEIQNFILKGVLDQFL